MNKKKNTYSLIRLLISTFLLIMFLTGCNKPFSTTSSIESYSQNSIFFDTMISITIYDQSEDHAKLILDNCMLMCEKYENLFDERNPSSDIYKLNNSKGTECSINPETFALIERGLYYSTLTKGKFDITIFPVSKLWDFHEDQYRIPTQVEINDALSHVGYTNVILNKKNNTAKLSDSYASIDLGGIAKGYIADRIADYITSQNISCALINMGGDMMLVGNKPNGTDFNIGINDPFKSAKPIMTLSLRGDIAVATSGTYERVIEKDNMTYHHILDSTTGYPVDTKLVSTTVICPKSTDADTLCTILFLLDSSEAIDYINSLDNTEAILIYSDKSMEYSKNVYKYIKQ